MKRRLKTMVQCVYVIDGDEGITASLKKLFGSVDIPVEAFANAQDFLNVWTAELDGCIIAELRLPQMGGAALFEHLRTQGSTLPFIFHSAHGDVLTAVRLIKGGAFEFLVKPAREQELLDSVCAAFREAERTRQKSQEREKALEKIGRLTPRELEVLNLFAEGYKSTRIATKLKIARKTLDIHRGKVFEKLETKSIGEVVRIAFAAGIGPGS